MSKVSSSAQIGGSNKPSIKQKNPLRGSYGKLTLDLKNLKTDLKSIVPGTTVAHDKHSQSPKIPAEKTGHVHAQTKSPRTKYNPSKLTIETSDHRDALSVEKKIYPQTTKAQHTPSISSGFEKFKKPNEKGDGSRAKESQIKDMLSSYESVFGKKGGEAKENSKVDTNSKYSNKTKIMEEPPKKASMPNTLSFTLNNIYTNTGSSSHRAPLNSPPSDRTNMNAQAIYSSLNRKNSQKSDVELEQQAANLVMNSQHLPQQHHNLNNLLVDLASISSEHMKGGVSKININSINNINTINNNIATGDRLPSPKESNNSSSQYNDLLRLLNDKNKEIQRLSQDKVELKSTLDVLTSEITNLKKMKVLVKEKEKTIENLQHSLTDAIRESEDLKKDVLNGSQDGTPHIQQHHFGIRKGNNPSIGDIEGIKALINQLKGITDSSGEINNDSLEQKTHLLETITKENQHSKLKKSDLSYNSFNLESRNERGSQSKEVVPDIYNRNFSETLEVPFGKKANESPYYDALKTTKKNLKANIGGGAKKGSTGSKKLVSESQTIKPSTAPKKGDSLIGTPRKPQIHTELIDRQYKIQPSTTTGADIDLFKRKFSHDPKLISDAFSADALNKKKLQADKKPAGHRMPSQDHSSNKESLDIGKALSSIKDRIGMLLSKHRDDHKKLKNTHDVYLKKLDTLINN